MAKARTVTKTLHYDRGMFVSAVFVSNRSPTKQELAGKVGIKTLHVRWSVAPSSGIDCGDAMSAFLKKRGYGIPVKFTMKLEGIPEKSEFEWK